jgi:uncharacterized protein DUF4242
MCGEDVQRCKRQCLLRLAKISAARAATGAFSPLSFSPMFNVSSATGHACRTRSRQAASKNANKREVVMKRYVVEREISGVGSLTGAELKGAAQQSNAALAKLAGKTQWIQSYVADNKTFCVYLAESEAAVHEHAKLSGFPASKVTEISGIIDPTTAR